YLHRNHAPVERFADYHTASMEGMHHGGAGHEAPPSAEDVLEGRAKPAHPMPDHPSHHPQRGARYMRRTVACVVLGMASSFGTVLAIDHSNLDAGRPLRLEDPYAISRGEITVELGPELIARRSADDRAAFALDVLYGLAPNLQVSVGSRFFTDPHGE